MIFLPLHFWKACEKLEVWKSNSSVLNLLDIPSVEDLLGILSVVDTLLGEDLMGVSSMNLNVDLTS